MADIKLPYHRKYRPKSLREYVGNQQQKKAVKGMLNGEVRPQLVLIKGFSGTGKTSMARLIAKEYLCTDNTDGACGKCATCKEVEQYIETGDSANLVGIREVDATDSNKKQDIEELLEDASMPSFDGEWKIYIIDECHMMTHSAQNRLLKTLEEPPEKVLIILCTTEAHKLLRTIISRCQNVINIQKPDKIEMQRLLHRVCKKEGIEGERRAFDLISARRGYKPREVLTTLESIVKQEGTVTYETTSKVLNEAVEKYYFEYFDRLRGCEKDAEGYIRFLYKVKEEMELEEFVEKLVIFLTRGVYVISGVKVDAIDSMEVTQYTNMVKQYTHREITYIMGKLMEITGITGKPEIVEMQLMLLGYKGLKESIKQYDEKQEEKAKLKEKAETQHIDTTQYAARDESIEGLKARLERKEKENAAKVKNGVMKDQKIGAEEVASMFGGTFITVSDEPMSVLGEEGEEIEAPPIEFE